MKNKLIFISLFFIICAQFVHAQECGGLKEGQEVRLDSANNSLSHFRTQDQDGLGTCYANTASVLLQSALPGNPEVSYIDLSATYGEVNFASSFRKEGKDSAYKNSFLSTEDNLLVEGGNVCDAIEAAQKSDGICERKDVDLEDYVFSGGQVASDPEKIQEKVFKSFSEYYEFLFMIFGNKGKKVFNSLPEHSVEFEKYKESVKNVLTKNLDEFVKNECPHPDNYNAVHVVTSLQAKLYQFLIDNKDKKTQLVRDAIDASKKLGSFQLDKVSQNEYAHQINREILSSLENLYVLPLAAGKIDDAEKAFRGTLAKVVPELSPALLSQIGGLSGDDLKLLSLDQKRYVGKDLEACKRLRKQYFELGLIRDDLYQDQCLKNYPFNDQLIANIFQAIGFSKSDNSPDSLKKFLDKLNLMTYDQAVMSLIGPHCQSSTKVKIPQNLSCNKIPIKYDQAIGQDDKFLRETKDLLLHELKKSFAEKRAVGLALCTSFFAPEARSTFYNKTKSCSGERHGFHAVAAIGYRCKKGSIQYLIQNSWGDWKENPFDDKEMGKAWISEDELSKNAFELQVLSTSK